MTTATLIVLALAMVGFGYRLLVGPSLSDRVLAIEGLLVVGSSAICVNAMRTGSGVYLVIVVVLTLVGFVSTAVVARFIEGRGA
jgi:multisubunit Na+/H+ antiporter MnhF subunit